MSDQSIVYSDKQLEDLETRLRIFPDDPVDPSVVRRLLDTAIRARRTLAGLRTGPLRRSAARTRVAIDYALGETEREGAGC